MAGTNGSNGNADDKQVKKKMGRPPGTANVKTREIADKAIAEGISPLEVMLEAMRKAHELAKVTNDPDDWSLAAGFAKDAAPYIHPRLQAIAHTGGDGGPVALTIGAAEKRAMAVEALDVVRRELAGKRP